MEEKKRSPFDASLAFVHHTCAAELEDIELEFEKIHPGLGKKAAHLVSFVTASFGVNPGDRDTTIDILSRMVEVGELEYDEESRLFFISQGQERYYLNPQEKSLLIDHVIKLAAILHKKFSQTSKKDVSINTSGLLNAVDNISNWVGIHLQESRD